MISIHNTFKLGEIVYLKTDTDQLPRMVTSIKIYVDNSMLYELNCPAAMSLHFECEITREKSIF